MRFFIIKKITVVLMISLNIFCLLMISEKRFY